MSRKAWMGLAGLLVAALLLRWSTLPEPRARLPEVPKLAVKRPAPVVQPGQHAEVVTPSSGPPEGLAMLRCGTDPFGRALLAVPASGGEPILPDPGGTFVLPPGEWRLVADEEGERTLLGRLALAAGESASCELGERPVRGTVRTPDGRPLEDVIVSGLRCGSTRTASDGTFTLETAIPGCSLAAWRQDGLLRRPSAPVVVTPWPMGEVELVVDDGPVGGFGAAIRAVEDGIRLQEIYPDSPGALAGLQAGDVVVAVDGTPVAEEGVPVDITDFQSRAMGPVGTSVTLTVRRGDETQEVTLTRARITER